MRRAWACPDIAPPKRPDSFLPIPGSREEFPHCPCYSLRLAHMRLPAEHLIDGAIHPAHLVQPRAVELEVGAIAADALSPKVSELVHLWMREQKSRRDYETAARRKI